LTKIKNLSTFAGMKRTFWLQIALITMLIGSYSYVLAMPAPKKVITLSQPDGSQLIGRMVGDEYFHYALSVDNYVLLPDKNGFYTYAVKDSIGNLKSGTILAKNPESRTEEDLKFLETISPQMHFSENQLNSVIERRISRAFVKNSRKNNEGLRSTENNTETNVTNQYPTTGTIKSIVILVNFSDESFKTENPGTFFSDMSNKKGFNHGKHIGSVKDYYTFNSGEKFSPEFVVIGPVTLDNPVIYYGANDGYGEDLRPARMVYDACMKASSLVDFSMFDADSDGYVDNIYVYYAGKGEADGGSANTIWPHSWVLSGENLTLTLNGKRIENYACSAELQGDESITGIGTFAHEYGHILGLVDTYDVDNETNGQSFDLGEWSLMAYGGYNADGAVPPSLTLIEKQMLGWSSPVELNDISLSLTLAPLDSSNLGYIIKTSNPGEYYLLENRQKRVGSWDEYILSHGLLIYHIDMRSDATIKVKFNKTDYDWSFSRLWEYNLTNAISTHQCIDIEEADNLVTLFNGANFSNYEQSVKGDPFPGSYNKSSFTDANVPSMKTWKDASLNKPITNIAENNGIISFDFRGGNSLEDRKPIIKPATEIGSFTFTANWKSLIGVTGYLLDIFRVDIMSTGDSVKTYLDGFENTFVTDTLFKINELDDQTIYQYRVRGTNGFTSSKYSDIAEVITPDATEIIAYVRDRTIYLKGIDKDSKVRLYNLERLVMETYDVNKLKVYSPGIYLAEVFIKGQRKVIKLLVK